MPKISCEEQLEGGGGGGGVGGLGYQWVLPNMS